MEANAISAVSSNAARTSIVPAPGGDSSAQTQAFLPIHGSASSASTLPQAAKAAKTSTTETTGSVNTVQKASQDKGTFVDPPQETTSSGAVGAVYEREFEKK